MRSLFLVTANLLSLYRKNAGVAQLAEQLTCNQQVGGSIPLTSSIFGAYRVVRVEFISI